MNVIYALLYIIAQPVAVITGIITFIFACVFQIIHKREIRLKQNLQTMNATIGEIYNNRNGSKEYLIWFDYSGLRVLTNTGHYYSRPDTNVCVGDTVDIGYCLSNDGKPYAIILDNRLIPVSEIIPKCVKAMIITCVICLCITFSWSAIAWFQLIF